MARRRIAKLLRRSPSLRRELPALLEEVHPNARDRAPPPRPGWARPPSACPFTLDQITDDWLPEG